MVSILVESMGLNTKIQVWRYNPSIDYEIIAGKSDKDNDLLSLNLANPNDWWFHVRGMPGSHVLLRMNEALKNININNKILNQAAAVAAYHSKARREKKALVSGTLAKYVTKPNNSKIGTVIIRNEKTFKVKPSIYFNYY